MDEQAAPEFLFEPGGFRRHDLPLVRHGHHLPHRGGIKRKGNGETGPVDEPLQLRHPPDAADKIDPRIHPLIPDAEDGPEEVLLEEGDVEAGDGIILSQNPRPGRQTAPAQATIPVWTRSPICCR